VLNWMANQTSPLYLSFDEPNGSLSPGPGCQGLAVASSTDSLLLNAILVALSRPRSIFFNSAISIEVACFMVSKVYLK